LKENIAGFDQQYYICGPPPMMVAIEKQLANLGVDKKLITEEEI
jgi:ferredoxin-NADP reductase